MNDQISLSLLPLTRNEMMHWKPPLRLIVAIVATAIASPLTWAQTDAQVDRDGKLVKRTTEPPATGPHGGTVRQLGRVRVETIVSLGGVRLLVRDEAGKPVLVDQGRGTAALQVSGHAKRYRYDLLPDGKGGLTAPANLSKIAGRQIELNIRVVGIAAADGRIAFREITSVPPSETQLAATAIARQKTCPVSGKPLGSMGDPLAIDVGGDRWYVCCAGCAKGLKADPDKYLAERLPVTVASSTDEDVKLIERQATCPVMDEPLGSMGKPVKILVGDTPIFLCCKGCIKLVRAEPTKYLAIVRGSPQAGEASQPDHEHDR